MKDSIMSAPICKTRDWTVSIIITPRQCFKDSICIIIETVNSNHLNFVKINLKQFGIKKKNYSLKKSLIAG